MADFRSIESRALDHRRLMQLSHVQYRIWTISILCNEARLASGTGIYHVSTTVFAKGITQDEVQEQLGFSPQEMFLKGEPSVTGKIGEMCRDFPDIIEYLPEEDMIFSKLMFDMSSFRILRTSKAICESVHKDYKEFSARTPERWWGEFMHINHDLLRQAWAEYCEDLVKKEKSLACPVLKTFDKLFELEKKFTSSSPEKPQAQQLTYNQMEL